MISWGLAETPWSDNSPLNREIFNLFLSAWNIDKTFSSAERSSSAGASVNTQCYLLVIPQRELQEASQAELWCCTSEMDLGENWKLDETNWLSRAGIHPFASVKGGRTSLQLLICLVTMLGAFPMCCCPSLCYVAISSPSSAQCKGGKGLIQTADTGRLANTLDLLLDFIPSNSPLPNK